MVNLLLESSPVVRVRLGATPELHSRADIVPAGTALPTLPTRNANLQRNSISNTPFLPHALSHRRDNTGRLMPEDQGSFDNYITVAIVIVIVQVRAAEGCGTDRNL